MYFTVSKTKISDQLDNTDVVNGIGGWKYWQYLKLVRQISRLCKEPLAHQHK